MNLSMSQTVGLWIEKALFRDERARDRLYIDRIYGINSYDTSCKRIDDPATPLTVDCI